MNITTMLLKASDKSILVFYKVSHFIILTEMYNFHNFKEKLILRLEVNVIYKCLNNFTK